ncbi:HNH endonuclease signature motif containing protein [Algivirga pacifica]|uniref:HNH domain-containing protein n=1 Tax=Algivirga pacifica TaxID=1162670 RepID=A0ABP9DGU0_9BACT
MGNHTDSKKLDVWNKATKVEGFNPNQYRQDACGAWMVWSEFGQETEWGWEIDHIFPESKGGTDHLDNLRAMHWENNRSKGNRYPKYIAKVTAENNKNIKKEEERVINEHLQKKIETLYKGKSFYMFFEIKKHIYDDSAEYWSDYIVGVTNDPKTILFSEYGIPDEGHCYIYRSATSMDDAKKALNDLVELGLEKHKGNNEGSVVFAFRKIKQSVK